MFDAFPTLETHHVFLIISKAFNKVWHGGLTFKFKSNGVPDSLLSIIESFLSNRFHRVLLYGNHLSGCHLRQACHKAPLLDQFFVIYINYFLLSTVNLFADDISLFFCCK